MSRVTFGVLSALALATPVGAAEVRPPADQRFAAVGAQEVPDFQRHVVPLLGRLGCNGRACHGSFQGQGGFRLSPFGYDVPADPEALRGGESPRANVDDPPASLMLQKPTRTVSHKGGKRLEVGSWQYHLLRNWIRAGAPAAKSSGAEFVALDVEPREVVFGRAGQTAQ